MYQIGGKVLKFEVHSPLQGVHVAAGYLGTVIAPHHSAKHMHRRVGSHQLVASLPVYFPVYLTADFRHLSVYLMQNMVCPSRNGKHRNRTAGIAKPAGVAGLSPTSREEGRSIQ